MNLYLVRHPEPEEIGAICYGRLDVAVDAAVSAKTLLDVRACIPAGVRQKAPVFTSPLSRCAQLANLLAAPRAAVVADELIEMDFGTWEGKLWEDVPRAQLDLWARAIWTYCPGGGENAERVAARWHIWHRRVRVLQPDAVIAVTHAGVIRVALALAGKARLDDKVRATVAFGSVHCIDDAAVEFS